MTDSGETRGLLQFAVSKDGKLCNAASNVEKLRRLWLDRSRISGDAIGPGDPGDFDCGAWHIGCHLVGAGGVCRAADGSLLWLEVSHDDARDRYFASVTGSIAGRTDTSYLDSAEGRELLAGAELLGFVEGNSTGRISARGVIDSPSAFNLWRRQDFDQPVTALSDGGKIWEHWCTLRDVRPSSEPGTSVLTAYISLASVLGDSFVATVARGRGDYGHPKQLCAMAEAGFVSVEAAMVDITPITIPNTAEIEFATAEPQRALRACAMLAWTNSPQYYMFNRRIDRWVDAERMKSELNAFRKEAL
jgi:hypothetical protein